VKRNYDASTSHQDGLQAILLPQQYRDGQHANNGAKMPKQRYPRHCLNRLIGLIIQRMARDINSTNGAVSARAFAWFTGEGRDWVCIMGIDETTLRAWMARQ
jgi:hypothetical protein